MRPVLLSVASVLVLIVPAAALPALPAVPAVADVPALPPTAAAPLGPEAALALASPTYDARMSGYLELAAGVLGMAAQEDLDSQALAAALSAAHARAVERLTDAPAPTYDPLGDLLARHDAAAKVLAAPEAERMIELLSAGTLRPGDATFDALSATLAAARLLADAEMLDAPAALAAAGATLDALGAATDLAPESRRLADALEAYAQADAEDAPMAKAAALLALQDAGQPAPMVPFLPDPKQAALALYADAGIEPTPAQHDALERFALFDPLTAYVVARAVHAHRVHQAGAAPAAEGGTADPEVMLAARLAAMRILAEVPFQAAQCVTGVADNTSAIFSYDLSCADSWYDTDSRFVFDLAGDDTYRNNAGGTGPADAGFDAAMLIDVAGADRYLASSPPHGGYIGSGHGGSGFLVDLAGDDRYEAHAGSSTVAAIGSAYGTDPANGLLVDGDGDDTYLATSSADLAANGGTAGQATLATAALLDLAGRDVYRVVHAGGYVNVAANGAGLGTYDVPLHPQSEPPLHPENERHAQALLADLGDADDTYDVQGTFLRTSANGGGFDTGRGLLLDGGGNDTYRAWSRFFGAMNGGGIGGRTYYNADGHLITTPSFGIGTLIDLGAGQDHYNGTIADGEHAVGGVNGGGAIRGSGLLVDQGGNDRYDARLAPADWAEGNIQGAANGAAADGGTGVLVDLGGNDAYDALLLAGAYGYVWGAANGAACGLSEHDTLSASDCVWSGAPNPSAGALLDLGQGQDTYRANLTGGDGTVPREVAYGAANGAATDAHAVLFDGGGDDTYWARIGDASFVEDAPAYGRGYGAIGGAAYKRGAAVLVDQGGNDAHDARVLEGAVNGAASRVLFDLFTTDTGEQAAPAAGVLLDQGGDDTYNGTVAVGGANGGAQAGAGALVDGAGRDVYRAEVFTSGGMNGGAGPYGVGLLVDGGGNDTYRARGHAFAGMNGAASGFTIAGGEQLGSQPFGAAGLLDVSGDDTYQGILRPEHSLGADFAYVMASAHGSGALGAGVLIDGGGNDAYDCLIEGYGALNGSGFIGQGTLLDAAGNDRFNGSLAVPGGAAVGAVNGAALQGLGLLVGGAGDDDYTGLIQADLPPFSGAAFGAANGAALVGAAMILDGHGANRFRAALGGNGVTNGAAGGFLPDLPGTWLDNITHLYGFLAQGAPNAFALLLGGSGDDTYTSLGVTQGAADAYGLGLLLDPAGNDTYTAGPVALAQGAARHGGTGVLADLVGNATFALLSDSFGQGFAEQGVGILLQADTAAFAEASVDVSATVGRSSGAGIGMRLVLGIGDIDVAPPTCDQSYEILDVNDTTEERVVKVCGPDEASSVYIIDPRTGEPMEDQYKPPVACGDDTALFGEECGDVVEAALGPDADDWLRSDAVTMRTSGGLALTMVGASNPADRILYGEYYVNTLDDSCSYGCWTMSSLFNED